MEIEVYLSAILALCSIALQIYSKFLQKRQEGQEGEAPGSREEDKPWQEDRRRHHTEVPLRTQEAPHKVINRKKGAQGFEIMVNSQA